MIIEERQLFLKEVKDKLADSLTITQLETVSDVLQSVLSGYDIIRIPTDQPSSSGQSLIDAFITAKEIEGRSSKTLRRYEYVIGRLIKEVGTSIEDMNVYHIRRYLLNEKQRGISDQTIEGYRCIFSSLFGWLQKEGLMRFNPVANIGAIKCEKKVRFPLSDIDIEKLNEVCVTDRNRAIFYFLLSTGCRISEVCALNREDINLKTLECVVHGKGNKQRTVFMSDVTAMLLGRYFENRKDSSPAIFVGKRSNRLTPSGVRCMLKHIAEKAGVENVHPHRFRRTLATNLINRGMQIQEVAFILGHDKLDTTMKYVYMAQDNVKISYRKFA